MMPIYQLNNYKKPTTSTGDLKTLVDFFYTVPSGPEPTDSQGETLFTCLAQVYGSSMKDNSILETHGMKAGVTLKIRDTRGEFDPDNSMSVMIYDRRYLKDNGIPIIWNVVDVRPDFENDDYVVVVLGVVK